MSNFLLCLAAPEDEEEEDTPPTDIFGGAAAEGTGEGGLHLMGEEEASDSKDGVGEGGAGVGSHVACLEVAAAAGTSAGVIILITAVK